MVDLKHENLGPVTLWNAITDEGYAFLNDNCTLEEKENRSEDYIFTVESRRNAELEEKARELNLKIQEITVE